MKAETVYVKRHEGEVYVKLRVTNEEKMFPGLTKGFATDDKITSALNYRILCRAKATGKVVPVRVFMLDQNEEQRVYLAVLPLVIQVTELACEMVDTTGWVVASYKQMISGTNGFLRKRLRGRGEDDEGFINEIPVKGNPGGERIEVTGCRIENGKCCVTARYYSLERRLEQRHNAEMAFATFDARLEEFASEIEIGSDVAEGVERTVDFKVTFDPTDEDLYILAFDGGKILPNVYAPLTKVVRDRLGEEEEK